MKQQEFLDKYGIKTTFKEMSKSTGYLKFEGDMLSSRSGKSAELMMYKQGLDFMFTNFIDSQLEKGLDNNRTLLDIDLAQFAKDFEDVMTNDPLDRDIGRKRKPYEGAELEVIDSLKSVAQKYGEEIKDVLASRIKSGVDLGAFRKSALIDLRRADSDEKRENTRIVSTMYLAMQKVIGERTWKDRINPLNWLRMINESVFMWQLNSQMKDITINNLSAGSRGARGYRNLDVAMENHAENNAYVGNLIDEYAIAELENYRNERAEQIPSEQELEATVVGRTTMTVAEASPDLDKTIEIKERYEDEPIIEHDMSRDSM